ncbi:MAG: tetratricopeptide repeat protein [Hyphomicrobiaceae bacterium]
MMTSALLTPRHHAPRQRHAHRLGVALLTIAMGLVPFSIGGALAQEPSLPDHEQQHRARPEPAPKSTPQPNAPKAWAPKPRSDGARPLKRVPQTAAEKAKRLSDLYAQLATAESAEKAKVYSEQIERLWRISGSDTVTLLMSRAAVAVKRKRFDLARKLYDYAVELAPDYPEAYNQRAYFHFTQNEFRAAVGDLRRVLALDPNHYKALEGLAQIWKETGDKKAAYAVTKHLVEVNPFADGAERSLEELKREVVGQDI